MAARLSRRKIALNVTQRLLAGEKQKLVMKEVAAFLIDTGRIREIDLLVRDIEGELAESGIVVADVLSAYPLVDELKKEVGKMVGAKDLQLRETVDPGVLGGMRINVPGKRYDGTLRHRIAALKAKQI
jgi:F-type H+-transporting ATPase subunit delta